MASQGATSESFILESVVRRHRIYKQTWTPFLGEKLLIGIEEDNSNDARAVAIRVVVGHLPCETVRIVWYFLCTFALYPLSGFSLLHTPTLLLLFTSLRMFVGSWVWLDVGRLDFCLQ